MVKECPNTKFNLETLKGLKYINGKNGFNFKSKTKIMAYRNISKGTRVKLSVDSAIF